jgi:hypothetical protein
MLCKAKFAILSEIHTKHTNPMWSQCRIIECYTLWYVKLPVGFKRLISQFTRDVLGNAAVLL